MEYVLKNEKKHLYLKSVNLSEQKIEFTKYRDEAKEYPEGSWYSDNELEFISFHFGEDKDPKAYSVIKDMKTVYE